MIEGLKVSVSSDELKAHLQNRSIHHSGRASFYKQQVKHLTEGGVDRSGATMDPVSSLEQQEKKHKEKQAFFKFLADHIIPVEDYLLTERDLEAIEIFSRYF